MEFSNYAQTTLEDSWYRIVILRDKEIKEVVVKK